MTEKKMEDIKEDILCKLLASNDPMSVQEMFANAKVAHFSAAKVLVSEDRIAAVSHNKTIKYELL